MSARILNPNVVSYSVDGAAKAIGISKTTVWRLVQAGELRTFKLGGRTLIRADELQAFRERQEEAKREAEQSRRVAARMAKRPARRRRKVICGVYILFVGGAITYVGRSTDVHKRLNEHRGAERRFDDIRIIACDEERSVWLEKELIRALKPAENRIRYSRTTKAAERALAEARLA